MKTVEKLSIVKSKIWFKMFVLIFGLLMIPSIILGLLLFLQFKELQALRLPIIADRISEIVKGYLEKNIDVVCKNIDVAKRLQQKEGFGKVLFYDNILKLPKEKEIRVEEIYIYDPERGEIEFSTSHSEEEREIIESIIEDERLEEGGISQVRLDHREKFFYLPFVVIAVPSVFDELGEGDLLCVKVEILPQSITLEEKRGWWERPFFPQSYLLGPEGQIVIAHPSKRRIGEKLDEIEELKVKGEIVRGEWYSYAPIKVAMFGREFIVAYVVSHSKILNSILMIFVSALGGAFIISISCTRRVTRPIEQLAMESKKIAAGNLYTTISNKDRGDEIGMLAEAVDNMRKSLQEDYERAVDRLGVLVHESSLPTLLGIRNRLLSIPEFSDLCESIEYEVYSIKGLLQFVRFGELDLTVSDLRGIIGASLKRSIALLEYKGVRTEGVEIEKVYDKGIPPLLLDKSLIERAFVNLICNAYEAMERKEGERRLGIRTVKSRDEAIIEIIDTGVGISENRIKEIFKLFITSKPKGIGLGLALAKRIVEAHQGRIEVTSRVGVGSTFTVVLPIKA